MIDITFDEALIARQLQRLAGVPYAVQRALYPAVGEVLDCSRTELAAHLVSDVPLPRRVIAKSIRLSQVGASGQNVTGRLTVASRTVPLIYYDVQPQELTARKGARPKQWPGFSFALRTGERREREEMLGLQYMRGLPFIARMGSHLGVYYRGSKNTPREAYGPAVQYHATTPEVERLLRVGAEDNMARILPRIVETVLAKHGGAS
ncbi:hypothetical protein [Megalodesulfovibrio paquesii]